MHPFLLDSQLALLGMVFGAVGGYYLFRQLFAGDVAYSVFHIIALFVAVISAGVGGIVGANVRVWYAWLQRRNTKQ